MSSRRVPPRIGIADLAIVGRSLVLALALGSVTFAIWLVTGREAFQGGITHVIADRGLFIYGALALGWASIGYGAALTRAGRDFQPLAVAVLLAWFFQGALIVAFGALLANELRTPEFRAVVSLTATGVILQPTAVLLGAWLARRRAVDAEA